MLSDLLYRARSVLRRKRVESELDDELRFHFEHQVEANVKAGMTLEEARRQARLKFGGFDQLKQELHDAHGVSFFDSLAQDMRFAARMLVRSPGFTLVAVLTLALGIGTNVAIFSFVDAWLIKGLPYPQGERLAVVKAQDVKKGLRYDAITPGDFTSLAEQSSSIASMAAYDVLDFNLTGDGTPERVAGGRVNSAFFETLGITPILGRNFFPSEDRLGANHVVILSRGLWASRYAADPRIIGRAIIIDGESYLVVGVLPANFQFPLIGIVNLWTPMAWNDAQRAMRDGAGYGAIARIKPGSNLAAVNQELAAISARLERAYPATNENEVFRLTGLREEIALHEGSSQILICFWIVGLILLIACANVASLMIARASGRAKEIAMRSALGATRRRIARQLLTEAALLFGLGGAAGLLFALLGMSWIDSLIPDRSRGYLVNYGHVELDLITLVYTFALALLCGVIFGLAPALQASKLNVYGVLKEAAGQLSSGKRGMRMRRIFVAGEIAIAVVVLISTALLVQSFVHMAKADPGFRPANLITAQLQMPKNAYPSDAQVRAFYSQALERMRALPQVEAAAVSQVVPFTDAGEIAKIYRADRPVPSSSDTLYSQYSAVTPEYFSTMGISLLGGRAFTAADDAGTGRVAVISSTLAKQFWPDADPLGQQLVLDDVQPAVTIVGIVGDVKIFRATERPRRIVFVPFAQAPARSAGIIVRSAGDPQTLATAMRDAIWSVDGQLPVSQVRQLDSMMKDAVAPDMVMSELAVFFGLLALFLGAIGIYGVMANSVTQRTNEIGIRMALGASPKQLIALVVGEGMKLAIIGIVGGVVVALALTRSMASILYNVKTSDPLIFSTVAILFALVAAAACGIPAWRALRVDPTIALRYE